MPLVDHYRKDFMDFIIGNRVVIISHQDVDAVCAVKILTNMFKTEGVPYILLSCDGINGMRSKYEEYSGQSDWFIMVNCGGSVDLLETLGNPPTNKNFFVMDYHRPIHIINVYNSSGQIRIVSTPEPEEKIPDFDSVFRADPEVSDDSDDEEMEDEDDEIDDNGMTGKMRRRAARDQRRKEHATWKEKREKILFKYREYAFYARPSALYALEIAWVMSRDDMESIWCTIVALTDAFVNNRLSRTKYTEFASTVNDHILRISNAEKLPRDCLKIRFERELYLFLYRNWSIYESAKHTPYLVNMLRTWSVDGNRKFHQLLAHLGLPLVEVRQKYINMSMDLRRQLIEMFTSKKVVEDFRLPDIVFGSFIAEIGYRPKFNALDVQLAALAVLEDPDPNKSSEVKFLDATHVLNVRDPEAFKAGTEKAKSMLKLLYSQVQMMVDTKQIQEMGPFLVVQLSGTLIEFNYFRRPSSIPLLVHFLQHAGMRSGKRKWRQSPWLIMIPHSAEYFIAIGLPPGAYDQVEKNVFVEVFRVLKVKMPHDIIVDNFGGWIVLVKVSKRQVFIDKLLSIT